MEIIKNKRILATIGLICLVLGTMLPYITFTIFGYSQSISLWGYWEGKVILVLTVLNAFFIFKDLVEKYVPQLFNNNLGRLVEKANNPKFSLIPTILVSAFAVYLFIRLDVDSEFAKNGLGFYLLWLGVICLVGHAIFYKKKKEVVMQTVSTKQVYPEQHVEQNQKFCPNCGAKVDVNAQGCFMCGRKF